MNIRSLLITDFTIKANIMLLRDRYFSLIYPILLRESRKHQLSPGVIFLKWNDAIKFSPKIQEKQL